MRILTAAIVLLPCLSLATAKAQAPAGLADPTRYVQGEESEALESLRLAEESMFRRREALVETPGVVRYAMPVGATSEVTTTPIREPGSPTPWLEGLELPDLPVRWHAQVVRYLEYFRENRRGRAMMRAWIRRSTRYGPMIRDALSSRRLPTDLRCVAMAESGFDPTVRSRAGAVGMWQFVERTGREYGLSANRWVDQRMDPVASTHAAAQMLGDLHRRFERWELALAAYNMGYGALMRAIRKYNTNDYWVLAELEAGLPFETTIYVAKIMACSLVMRNAERFGYDVETDAPLEVESFEIGGGVNLGQLARAAGVDRSLLSTLNPHLRRGRTPPGRATHSIHIPLGQSEQFARAWSRIRARQPAHRSYVMRFGESLREVARRFRTRARDLRTLNGIEEDEIIGAGVVLLVPAVEPRDDASDEPPVVAVPSRVFSFPDRRRVFYEVHNGEAIEAVASFFEVSVDEVREWNDIDATARLHSGMFLQLFVPASVDLATAVVLTESQVRTTSVGTEAFFDEHEERQGRVRFRWIAREGDSLRSLSRRFGLSVGSIARINRFSRRSDLRVGQEVILYADRDRVPPRILRATEAASSPPAAAAPETEAESEPAEPASAEPEPEPAGQPAGAQPAGAQPVSNAQPETPPAAAEPAEAPESGREEEPQEPATEPEPAPAPAPEPAPAAPETPRPTPPAGIDWTPQSDMDIVPEPLG